MSEKDYEKIKAEKGIKHVFVLDKEFDSLKVEMADNKSLKEENEILKQKLADIQNKKPGRKPKEETENN